MNDTEQSHCRIRRTGVVRTVDDAFVHAEIEGKLISIPFGKCEPTVRSGDAIAWDGKMWAVNDSDVPTQAGG